MEDPRSVWIKDGQIVGFHPEIVSYWLFLDVGCWVKPFFILRNAVGEFLGQTDGHQVRS